MISIAGLRPDDLRDARRRGLRLAHLERLAREGAQARLVGVGPTATHPSHTTLVTGVAPERHGIRQDKPFDPLGRSGDGWYWYAEDIRVPTLWDAARGRGLAAASVDWPVTVGAEIDYNIAQYWRADAPGAPDGAKLARAMSTKGLLAEAERSLGPHPARFACGIEDDERRAKFAAYLLERKQPRLLLSYFCSLDQARHGGDPERAEVSSVLERLDAVVGRLRAAAERAGGGQAVVAVVSGHGFTVTDRELDFNEVLRNAGLLQIDALGRTRGWRAVAWGHGGGAAIVLRDTRDEEARRAVRTVLRTLAEAREDAVESVIEEPAAVPGGAPGVAFRVFLRLDTRLVDRRAGVVARRSDVLGDHGHDPLHPAMDAAFLIAGDGIQGGQDLGRVDMRDVAPTLAGLLGLTLPEAEGRDLLTPPPVARR